MNENKLNIMIAHPFASIYAGTAAICCILGWIGGIFGPRFLLLFGIVGFLAGILGHFFTRPGRTYSEMPSAPDAYESAVLSTIRFLDSAILASIITLLVASRITGVADFPAFKEHAVYELRSQSVLVSVSRARYILVAASFATFWHSMALQVVLSTFAIRVYGRDYWRKQNDLNKTI